MNGKYKYMIGKIARPINSSENKPKDIAQYVNDWAKWNIIFDSVEGAIWCTMLVHTISHVYSFSNFFMMWKKFKSLYKMTNFLQYNIIPIWLFTKTLEDFQRVDKFANVTKKEAICLKKLEQPIYAAVYI